MSPNVARPVSTAIGGLDRLLASTRAVKGELTQMQFRIEDQLRYLRSKAHTPASHASFQRSLADDVRKLDRLINDWTNSSKHVLDAAPLKSEPITPGGKQ